MLSNHFELIWDLRFKISDLRSQISNLRCLKSQMISNLRISESQISDLRSQNLRCSQISRLPGGPAGGTRRMTAGTATAPLCTPTAGGQQQQVGTLLARADLLARPPQTDERGSLFVVAQNQTDVVKTRGLLHLPLFCLCFPMQIIFIGVCYVFIWFPIILNQFKSIIIALNPFKMYLNQVPGILIHVNQFESNSYVKQVSLDLGIWCSENMRGLGFGNLRIWEFAGCENIWLFGITIIFENIYYY